MKAFVLEKYNSPLIQKNVPDPVCGDNDVVVKISAAGVCGTDMKIYKGLLDGIINLPLIPGHESAGIIVEKGKNVKELEIGDKGVVYHYIPCGICELCRSGHENICFDIKRNGFECDGGFAEYIAVSEYNFCRTTGDIDLFKAAVLPDAVLTPYHAIKTLGKLSAGKKVLIIGTGGLGLHAVQIVKILGSESAAADVRDAALLKAAEQGASLTINTKKESLSDAVMEWTGGKGVDLVIDGVGNNMTFNSGISVLKKGGTLVLMGYDPVNPVNLSPLKMHYNEWFIIGSRLGTKNELSELLFLLENKRLSCLIDSVLPMQNVNSIYQKNLIESAYGRILLDNSSFS